jgi:hypothetical protein
MRHAATAASALMTAATAKMCDMPAECAEDHATTLAGATWASYDAHRHPRRELTTPQFAMPSVLVPMVLAR